MRLGRKIETARLAGLKQALRSPGLDERWRLVAGRVVAGETYAKIGSEIGVSRQRIEQIVRLVLNSGERRSGRWVRPRIR